MKSKIWSRIIKPLIHTHTLIHAFQSLSQYVFTVFILKSSFQMNLFCYEFQTLKPNKMKIINERAFLLWNEILRWGLFY